MASPIAEGDIALVRGAWTKINENAEENGVIILKALLDKFEYYTKMDLTKDITADKVAENKAFRSHCVKMMKNLDAAMKSLEKPKDLTTALANLAKLHKIKKIEGGENYENMKPTIIEVLTTKFNITKEESDAFTNVLNATFDIIKEKLKK